MRFSKNSNDECLIQTNNNISPTLKRIIDAASGSVLDLTITNHIQCSGDLNVFTLVVATIIQ